VEKMKEFKFKIHILLRINWSFHHPIKVHIEMMQMQEQMAVACLSTKLMVRDYFRHSIAFCTINYLK